MTNESKITVVAVDDHNLILSGIKLELMNHPQIELIGSGTRGRDVMPLVEEHRPNVLILDIEMPEGDDKRQRFGTIAAIADIREKYPKTKILVISHESSRFLVNAVLSAGARGYVDKLDLHCANSIPIAIETVHYDSTYLSSKISKLNGQDNREQATILTRGEQVVLELRGKYPDTTIEELAQMKGVTIGTYKKQLKSAANKLNAKTTYGAVLKAMQLGIIPIRAVQGLDEAGLYGT